ncbi:amino acid ABC transporter permease [Cutibacterium sp.]|uniref:amino acid ABC transporter permease n=1 Tax=Cutibacterium sp. TaxID=1912221 RepID=UPI0026DB86BA|nr:ABC transporter permease subunit [Cutibacterium sp.]MDO4411487.1 ABC transporter permease subunit [Cutibacterium sp.]
MSVTELIQSYGKDYLLAVLTTWKLTVVAFVAAFLLGCGITVIRICPIPPLRWAGNLYVQVFRNIPGVSLLVIFVYALPYLDIVLSYYACVLAVTILIPASFCSEYLLAGINTIRPGEIEAAYAMGLRFNQIARRIVIPQAIRSSVLPLTNLAIATLLTTSLASQVPLDPPDLTGIVTFINSRSVGGVTAFVISALFYCLTALVIARVGTIIDRKVRILR